MRTPTKDLIRKVHNRLINTKSSDIKEDNVAYVSARTLAEDLGMKVSTARRVVKLMILEGIGVYSRTRKGYVLAEFASKRDDVNAIRKMHGRRTADSLSLVAAQVWMRGRWKTDWERRQLGTALKPLLSDMSMLEQSNVVLLKAQNTLGV